ncbi:MAG: helix-turn-helix domain-containing protein [Lachnotalea sp.]
MDANERIKLLREHLDISQEKFGEYIGLSKSGISSIESGNRNVTEKHIKLVRTCFNVNEVWLRTGEGEMFNEMSEDDELALYVGKLAGSDNEFKKKAILALCKLPDEVWEVLKRAALDSTK